MDLVDISFIIILVVCLITIPAAMVVHEYIESDYDKCLDSCDGLYENEGIEKECISECNLIIKLNDGNCVNSAPGDKQ